MKLSEAQEKYKEKFGHIYKLSPAGVDDVFMAEVLLEHIEKGEKIPDNYNWYADFPDDAVI